MFDYVIETLDEPLSKRLILDFHRMLKDRTLDHERGFKGRWKNIPNQISGIDLKLAEPWEIEGRLEESVVS